MKIVQEWAEGDYNHLECFSVFSRATSHFLFHLFRTFSTYFTALPHRFFLYFKKKNFFFSCTFIFSRFLFYFTHFIFLFFLIIIIFKLTRNFIASSGFTHIKYNTYTNVGWSLTCGIIFLSFHLFSIHNSFTS